MQKTISILSEEFQNEKTGEKIEGVTIMVDGILKQFIDIIKFKNNKYQATTDIIQDALMRGFAEIKDETNTRNIEH